MADKELAALRIELSAARKLLGEMAKQMQTFIDEHTTAKTAYERAFARAKVKEFAKAKTTADKQPTILNALAEIDDEVMVAKDSLDLKYAKLEAFKVEFGAVEQDIMSIKKSMGTIESEMRTFGG